MTGKYATILMPIASAVGADVTLFGAGARLEGATGTPAPYRDFSEAEIGKLPTADAKAGVTYFAVPTRPARIAAIAGCEKSVAVYAKLAAQIIADALLQSIDDADRMRLVLSGEATETQILSVRSTFREGSYYMLALVSPHGKQASLLAFMQAFKGRGDILVKMDDDTLAYARAIGADDEYQSGGEFAGVLRDNLSEELPFPIKICIGDVVHTFDDLEPAYAHAVFACRYGELIDPASSIYSYKEYALVKMLAEVKKETFLRYSASLVDDSFRAVLADAELMTTAEMFMKNSLNISETSRNMYVHRNTLIYRLDKIEKATGLNIRQFNDAFTFRLIQLIYKLNGTPDGK